MNSQLKTRKIVLINAILIIAIVLIQAATNVLISSYINNKISTIEEIYNRKVIYTSRMRHIAHQRTLSTLSMYLSSDPWKQDDYFIVFMQQAEDFIKTRQALESLPLLDNEWEKLQQVYAVIRRTEPLQLDIVKRIKSGDTTDVFVDLVVKDLPMEEELSSKFIELTKVVNQNYAAQRAELNQQSANSTWLSLIWSLIIVISILMIIRRVVRKLESIEISLMNEKEQLGWDAVHDPLTGVYNRRWLIEYLSELSDSNVRDSVHSLIFIDLDDFKSINDRFSHDAGDLYLKEVVEQIKNCIRANDQVVRLGGDEFIVFLNSCNLDMSQKIAECVLKNLISFTITYKDQLIKSKGCSIGVTEFRASEADFENVVHQADNAAMRAKHEGKNRFKIHHDEQQANP